jgi:hypothetical protein
VTFRVDDAGRVIFQEFRQSRGRASLRRTRGWVWRAILTDLQMRSCQSDDLPARARAS